MTRRGPQAVQPLKHFADDEREREKLKEFSSPASAVDVHPLSSGLSSARAYTGVVIRVYSQIQLNDARGDRRVPLLPVTRHPIFGLFPPLRPHEFSIARIPSRSAPRRRDYKDQAQSSHC